MKLIPFLILMSCLGCSPSLQLPNLTERKPNVLSKNTEVVVSSDAPASLSSGTLVQTEAEPAPPVVVALAEPTIAVAVIDKSEVELPKDTKVVLPPKTSLAIQAPTPIKLVAATDIILPEGTIITMSKVNWYAVLFFALLILVAAYFYLANHEDTPTPKKKK